MPYKIIHERDKCIACGACAAVCPDNWKIAGDGKSDPVKTEISDEEYECNHKAEQICPVHCIKIEKA